MTSEEIKKKFPIGSKVKLATQQKVVLCPALEYDRCYIVKDILFYNNISFIRIVKDFESDEDEKRYEYFSERFEPVESSYTNINSSLCPQCNEELVDKYSEWAGKDIKKCKACGWC